MTVLVLFLTVIAAYSIIRLWLIQRQITHIRDHRNTVPQPFQAHITPEEHYRSADYSLAHLKVSKIQVLVETTLLVLMTVGGGLRVLSEGLNALHRAPLTTAVILVLSVMAISALATMPLRLYRTFVIENQFGFNQQSTTGYMVDVAKYSILTAAMAAPLIYGISWLMSSATPFWWLGAWAVVIISSLALSWIGPVLIAPLFNTFEPLRNQELRQAIKTLLKKTGFTSKGLYVMDGSRRSSHGNAYFTGLGKSKRIVFYDTLLERLNQSEIIAVLSHELGHFKYRHLLKTVITGAGISFTGFALLAMLQKHPELMEIFTIDQSTPALILSLAIIVAPIFRFPIMPLISGLSRHHEFQADQFAAKTTSSHDMESALVRLYTDNASSLTADPVYAWFYYSHPAPLERINRLQHVRA
ncbi:MAG: M48 family metallopeptidase [Thiotrichales bacterium]